MLPEDPAYATLGGFVLAQLGVIPGGGESFEYGGYRFTVVEMDRRRVAGVKLQRIAPGGGPAVSAAEPKSPEMETTETRAISENAPSGAGQKTRRQ